MEPWDLLLRNVHLATMRPGQDPYGTLLHGAVALRGGRIAWLGKDDAVPASGRAANELDGEGRWVTPGLIDCHTHLVFAGNRASEFERRLAGESYAEILALGGGILSTVRATREASEDDLFGSAARRLRLLRARGVTAVEVKSGYGLDLEAERKMLRVARRLEAESGMTVQSTLLAAHAVPLEFSHDRSAYVRLVCEEILPAVAADRLVDAVDAFCEGIAFTPAECGRVLEAGAAHGLAGRLHADQLTECGGAALAARSGARTADHLEHASPAGVAAMAEAGTVAVLLPGAAHFLQDRTVPPVQAMREAGVPIALASDLNPGSSPLLDPLGVLSLGCLLFGLTPAEALAGLTRVGARALGLEGTMGVLLEGMRGDVAVWSVDHPSELAYWIGADPCWWTILGGRMEFTGVVG